MKLMRKLSTVFLSNVRQFSGVASNCGLATISPEDVHKHVPTNAADFILERAQKLKPDNICVLKGGRDEWDKVLLTCQQQGLASKLAGLHNCYITRTDPADVARVESKTFIASSDKRTTVAQTRSGSPSQLGNWMSVDEMDQIFNQRYDGAMKGRTMYVIPFSMGIIGGQMFKLGIELTDSPYVAAAMSIMTRHVGSETTEALMHGQEFIKCTHSVGVPLPAKNFQRDGKPYWEGIDAELNAHEPIIDWQGRSWHPSAFSSPAAHPNSRFCIPATNLENLDEAFHSGDGVAIDAIMFGGRRPEGVPLVYESFNWQHGIYYGASMRSEATAAAEHKGKVLMHDPFAMRPFFGYNFGSYLQHWLDLAKKHPGAKLPRIYKVNWFRKCPKTGQFLWPGFGENIRVLDWIIRRCSGESGIAEKSELGFVPRRDKFRLDGLKSAVDWDALFSVDKNYWSKETKAVSAYLDEQVGDDLPNEIVQQKDALLKRLSQ